MTINTGCEFSNPTFVYINHVIVINIHNPPPAQTLATPTIVPCTTFYETKCIMKHENGEKKIMLADASCPMIKPYLCQPEKQTKNLNINLL